LVWNLTVLRGDIGVLRGPTLAPDANHDEPPMPLHQFDELPFPKFEPLRKLVRRHQPPDVSP
jgi:hypothetical protein